jgi:hypothetical protein
LFDFNKAKGGFCANCRIYENTDNGALFLIMGIAAAIMLGCVLAYAVQKKQKKAR